MTRLSLPVDRFMHTSHQPLSQLGLCSTKRLDFTQASHRAPASSSSRQRVYAPIRRRLCCGALGCALLRHTHVWDEMWPRMHWRVFEKAISMRCAP